MDTNLQCQELPIRCMKKPRAAVAHLRIQTTMHGVVQVWVRAVQIVCNEAVTLYGCELWWDTRETGRREAHQLLLMQQARTTLGALPRTPLVALTRDSGLTPGPAALDSRQQQFTARLANACEGSKLKVVHDHLTPGTPICKVI